MAGELSSNQLQAAGELEIEMMQDLYKRQNNELLDYNPSMYYVLFLNKE